MLQVIDIRKTYRPKHGAEVRALDGVSIKFPERGLVFILGKSGSGKSTLLNVLGGLDQVDSGEIIIKEKSSKNFSQSDFDSYRNTYLGFIFQEYNILNEFTVGDNIALALQLQGKKASKEAVREILEQVDLAEFAKRKPMTLSGGQKQRVAIARALIKNPEIILADEPTGALDSNTGIQVFDTLKKLSKDKLVIVVSHDRDFAERYGDRVIEMKDGQVLRDDEKTLSKGETVSTGFSALGEDAVTIEKGHVLTQKDVEYLNKILAKSDAIITADERTNIAVRAAAHIDENGHRESFKPTDEDKISYQGGQFKLIRSHLPASRAIKIGASALKSKPFRLFMTIFLSFIGLGIFGMVATMASFDQAKSITDGLARRNFKYGTIDYEKRYGSDKSYWYNEASLGPKELEQFESTYHLKADPLFAQSYWNRIEISNNILSTSEISSSDYSFYSSKAYGAIGVDNARLAEIGYQMAEGRLPQADDEIAITDYHLFELQKTGYVDRSVYPNVEIQAENVTAAALIGKRLTVGITSNPYGDFKIVGVINTGVDYSRYATFQEKNLDYGAYQNNGALYREMLYRIHRGYPNLLYIAPSFVEELSALPTYVGGNMEGMNLWAKDQFSYQNRYGDNQYLNMTGLRRVTDDDLPSVRFFQAGKTSLSGKEVLICDKEEENLVDLEKILDTPVHFNYKNPDPVQDWNGEYTEVIGYHFEQVDETRDRFNEYVDSERNRLIIEYVGVPENLPTSVDFNRFVTEFYRYNYDGWKEYAGEITAEMKQMAYAYCIQREWEFPEEEPDKYSIETREFFVSHYAREQTTNVFGGPRASYFYSQAYQEGRELFDLFVNDPFPLNGTLAYREDYGDGEEQTLTGFTVVGFFHIDTDDWIQRGKVYVSDEIFGIFSPYFRKPFSGLMFTYDNASLLDGLVRQSLSKGAEFRFTFENEAADAGMTLFSIVSIFTNILIYVAIALAAFSALLMANFISTSISYKKREIGILRAVGARSADVFGIFFSEAAIIALIEFVLSFVGVFVAMIFLNNYLSAQLGVIGSTFIFGPLQWAIMLGIAFAVAFLASFFPVLMVAKKRPVEAIRSV